MNAETALKLAEARNELQKDIDEYTLARCHLYIGDDLRQLERLEEADRHLDIALTLSKSLEERY